MPNPGTFNRNPQPTGRPQASAQMPAARYFQNGKLRPELVDQEAEQVGQILAERMTHTQLRRFYGDVLALRRRFEQESSRQTDDKRRELFESMLPEIRMLRAKAYYANKRSSKTFPNEMKTFVEQHVKAINGWKDFQAFCKHFEAVVAFHKALRRESD